MVVVGKCVVKNVSNNINIHEELIFREIACTQTPENRVFVAHIRSTSPYLYVVVVVCVCCGAHVCVERAHVCGMLCCCVYVCRMALQITVLAQWCIKSCLQLWSWCLPMVFEGVK